MSVAATGAGERLEGLEDPHVAALQSSQSGLWIGGRGCLRLVGGQLEVLGGAGLPSDRVTEILEARDGTVWVGTVRGLGRRRPGAKSFEPTNLVGTASVQALLEDKKGSLWVGTEGGHVLRVIGERAEPLTGTTSPSDVHSLVEDNEGDIWAGAETGGLFRLRWGQAQTIAREEGLSSDVVWAVREGRGGIMWVASDGGLDRLAGDCPEPAT